MTGARSSIRRPRRHRRPARAQSAALPCLLAIYARHLIWVARVLRELVTDLDCGVAIDRIQFDDHVERRRVFARVRSLAKVVGQVSADAKASTDTGLARVCEQFKAPRHVKACQRLRTVRKHNQLVARVDADFAVRGDGALHKCTAIAAVLP